MALDQDHGHKRKRSELFENGLIGNALIGSLQLQKPAPPFRGTAVVNGEFKEISLADYKGKYVVFFFYPLDL